MAKVEMSLAEGLVRKKTLEKQIRQLSMDKDKYCLCDFTVGTSEFGKRSDLKIEDMKQKAEAYIQKVKALISNYETLCKAIHLANATTKLTINGKEMTIVEAIALKSNPVNELKTMLVNYMDLEYTKTIRYIERHNMENCSSEQLNKYIESFTSTGVDIDPVELEKKFHEIRDAKLIDPLNILDLADELRDTFTSFDNEVNYRLAEVNARTIIEVEFED